MDKDAEIVKLTQTPHQILHTPLLNKGSAFTEEERDELGLHGLIPYHISTLEEQLERNYRNFSLRRTALGRYVYLTSLMNRNELLFYQLVDKHVKEMLPYIYTPTVGEASQQYSFIYMQQRGMYISYPMVDKIDAMFQNIPQKEVDVVVLTDGERVLGLGDQGIGGMAIPIGKLCLYTLFAGIHPSRTLPIMIDVGTNNEELRQHPLYLGWRHPRVSEGEYMSFIDHVVKALKKHHPHVLLQWEDFGREHARPLLKRYQDQILSFNDDIQGTAASALAGLLAAINGAKCNLYELRIVIYGGGSAGQGIARNLVYVLMKKGLSEEEAYFKIYMLDIHGLIHEGLDKIEEGQKPFSRKKKEIEEWDLSKSKISLDEAIPNIKPHVLIGVSTCKGAFTEKIVKEMASHVERPIIFPLSNPTEKSEAKPKDLIRWTQGKAIIATGSPFEVVEYKKKMHEIAQCNNVYIFPGVGLGVIAAKANRVTPMMFLRAAETLAEHSPSAKDSHASLFPPIEKIREISREIAIEVAKVAIEEGQSDFSLSEIGKVVDSHIWIPHYPKYER